MADMELRTTIIGATLHLDRSEVYGIVNTAERLSEHLDSCRRCRQEFSDSQATKELEHFYDVSRAVAPMIDAEFEQ